MKTKNKARLARETETDPQIPIEQLRNMRKRDLDAFPELSVATYEAWQALQPPSPVDSGLRLAVRGLYSLMDLRICMGNQCFAQFRSKLGFPPGEKVSEAKSKAQAKVVLERLAEEHDRIAEGVTGMLKAKKFKKLLSGGEGVFSDYAEFLLCDMYVNLLSREVFGFTQLTEDLRKVPVYTQFLRLVGGCGNALAGFLLAELNPYRARHASSFWRYLGLDVASTDGTGRSSRKNHHEETWVRKKVKDQDKYYMEKTSRMTHNPKVKSKVVKVLGECIIKANLAWVDCSEEVYAACPPHYRRIIDKNEKTKKLSGELDDMEVAKLFSELADDDTESPEDSGRKKKPRWQRQVARFGGKYGDKLGAKYAKIYLDYKHRKSHCVEPAAVYRKDPKDPEKEAQLVMIPWNETTPTHRDNAARRRAVKLFIADLWAEWRKLEGLPVSQPYHVAKLGLPEHGDPNLGCYQSVFDMGLMSYGGAQDDDEDEEAA